MSKLSPIEQLPMRFTKTLIQRQKSSTGLKKKLQQSTYFCHFSNALYMGGIRAYKKNNKGIILHDDGTCAIVSYTSDVPNGHHILFKNGMILSKIHHLDRKTDYVLRINRYLIQVPYNEDQQVDGRGTLIDFSTQQIWYLYYKKGYLREKKIIREEKAHQQIFIKRNFKYLIGQVHQSVFDLKFQRHDEIKILKEGDSAWIGFTNQNDKKSMNGLAFKISITQKGNNQIKQFDCSILQRGQYEKSRLHGLGERYFSNGNLYYGRFQRNQFQGKGFLSYPEKDKWIFGVFENGNLSDLVDVNSDQYHDSWRRNIKKLHSQQQKWIDRNVHLFSEKSIIKLLNESLQVEDDSSEVKKRSLQKEKRKIAMSKIQENFLFSNSRVEIDSIFEMAKQQKQRSLQKDKSKSKSKQKPRERDNSNLKFNYKGNKSTKPKQNSFDQKQEAYQSSLKHLNVYNQSQSRQPKSNQKPDFVVIDLKQPKKTVTVGNIPKIQASNDSLSQLYQIKAYGQPNLASLRQNQSQTLGYKSIRKSPPKRHINNQKKVCNANKSYNKIRHYDTDQRKRNVSRTPVKAEKTFDSQTRNIIKTVHNQQSYDKSKNYKTSEIKNQQFLKRTQYKYLEDDQQKKLSRKLYM